LLPAGVHVAPWAEVCSRYGWTEHRLKLLSGLRQALMSLKKAGCKRVYLDGSFVTAKEHPGDFDGCWEEAGVDPRKLHPVLLKFEAKRAAQKAVFGGEMFPASAAADTLRSPFVRFFQTDKATGDAKGIVRIDLTEWEP